MNQQMAQKIGQDAQQFQINFPISCKSVRTSLWGFLLEPEEYFILKAKVLNKTLKYPISKLLPLLPSRFSRVRLCATPWTAAYQASPSVGFSRQEHWSGLPFPSPSKLLLAELQVTCSGPYIRVPSGQETYLQMVLTKRYLLWYGQCILFSMKNTLGYM